MSVHRASKGKKRTREETLREDEQTSDTPFYDTPDASQSSRTREKQPALPVKKLKRAETRKCPVCDEPIPLRLLGKHAELESERLEEIIQCIGSTEVLGEAEPEDSYSARTRRSAIKARQNLKPGSSSTSGATLEQTMKTLRLLKKHRKQRHAKLRELTKESEDDRWWGTRPRRAADVDGEGQVCPVCAKFVRGDVDVVEAHVDACLAFLRLTADEEERQRRQGRGSADAEMEGDVNVDGEDGHYGVMEGVSFQGTGFDIRNRNHQDVDEDIDVDGEDEVLFGAPQFTEQDVLAPPVDPADYSEALPDIGEEMDIDIGIASGSSTPEEDPKLLNVVRRLVQDPKLMMDEVMGADDVNSVDSAVELARRSGDQAALVRALENRVNVLESMKVSSSASLLCRICLDPYSEPTVSTGCWHTCCRECWLRCLGSTKMCPICKRITGATDLRRIYL